MLSCGTCRSQMLEYLYDLLEDDERQAWEMHLKGCAACQAELARAKAQQQLLARAAKMEFPNVHFTPPVGKPDETKPGKTKPDAIETGRTRVLPVLRKRWFAAAGLMLAVALAGAAGWYVRDYRRSAEMVLRTENRLEQAKKERLEAEQRLARLPEQKQERIAAVHKTQQKAQLQVEVQGPAAVRVGAPTDYIIYTKEIRYSKSKPTFAQVSVEVRDHGQTIAKPVVTPDRPGVYRFTLPADLPVRPDSQPILFVSARSDEGAEVELREEIPLAAPVYNTHLEIDKPLYQLGETVHFRSLTLDRFSLKPAEQELDLQFLLAMPGPSNPPRLIAQGRASLIEERPNGAHPLLGPDGKPLYGIGVGSFLLDPNGPEGEYTLIVREKNRRFPEQRRKFRVYRYGNRPQPETGIRSTPNGSKELAIEFYPEGGDLVAGLHNRVYFQVRNALGQPADLRGQLLEDGKPMGVAVQTLADEKTPELNQGLGRFEFTPKAGHKYELKVEAPAGISKLYELPPVKLQGVVLSVPTGVVKAGEAIPVTVRSTVKRSFLIGAYCRGRLLDSTEIIGEEVHTELRPVSGVGGVCRITVFEILADKGSRRVLQPVAERLLYRQPAQSVQLKLKPDQRNYLPRQTVKLGIEAANDKGELTPAIVLLRVIDKSVLTRAGDKTLRSMPAHFLLTTEVRRPEDLEYADFLLGSHPQAAAALDLLLGTQGWRRFAEQDPAKFRREQKEEAERLLAILGQSQIKISDWTQLQLQHIEREYTRQAEELAARMAQAQKAEQEARDDPAYRAALLKLKTYEELFARLQLVGAPILEAILVMAALGCLTLGLYRRGFVWALPYYATSAACAALALLLTYALWRNAPLQHPDAEHVAHFTDRENQQKPSTAPKHSPTTPNKLRPQGRARPSVANSVGPSLGGGKAPILPQRPLEQTEQTERKDQRFPDRPATPIPAAGTPMLVREYKHTRIAGPAEERSDFAETLYWHPALVLPGGQAEVTFDLCDSLGAFEITAFAHTLDGRLGSATQILHVQKSQESKPRSP
jgi:hypothetical protein